MNDAKILAACMQARKAYERVSAHLTEKDLSPQGAYWWKLIQAWYARDSAATAVDREILGNEASRELALAKHKETLMGYYRDIPEVPSAYNVAQELLSLKRRNKELEYAAALASGDDLSKRRTLHAELGELLAASDLGASLPEIESANDDGQMFSLLSRKNCIRIFPMKLNDRAGGGAIPGDHIVLFGRPEAGKSLFAVNMAAGFLRQQKKVLWLGNEENVYKTRNRILCNMSGMTGRHVERETAMALERARAKGFGLLDTRQGHPGSIAQIDELLDELKPDILVLDQIRNLECGEEGASSSMTKRLERLAIDVRSLIAKYHVVGVSITQAGDKTEKHGQEPPAWLTMSDVDSSRTGLPAHADLLVGVGVTQELAGHGQRAISLPKNKLGNTHEGFLVDVDLDRSIVK